MRIAYADPPYLVEKARSYYRHAPDGYAPIDYPALIERLTTYDGWALSLSAGSLQRILPLCPESVRVGIWARSGVLEYPRMHPANGWEPVIFKPARKLAVRGMPQCLDWIKAERDGYAGKGRPHIMGKKPDRFSFWLFSILHMGRDDEFDDIFPGSGAVTRAWEQWRRQLRLEVPA